MLTTGGKWLSLWVLVLTAEQNWTGIEMVFATVIVTAIVLGVFSDKFAEFEARFIAWASRLTSTNRWFTIWLLIFPLWVIGREILRSSTSWYTADLDNTVLAGLFSAAPFFIENLLKASTAKLMDTIISLQRQIIALQHRNIKQTDHITALSVAIREHLDRAQDRDEVLHTMVERLLDKIEVQETEA